MEKEIFITADGSHSILLPGTNLSYHSKYGALQESIHVFIEAGLKPGMRNLESLCVFEMGFGTGLNALLTLMEAEKEQKKIHYTAIEAYPLDKWYTGQINYCQRLGQPELQKRFEQLHASDWEKDRSISPHFTLCKIHADFRKYFLLPQVHLIYFDAFAPAAQPELWTAEIFNRLYEMLFPGGALLTYCSKSTLRKTMEAAGFSIEKLPGPAHKREIIRAAKTSLPAGSG